MTFPSFTAPFGRRPYGAADKHNVLPTPPRRQERQMYIQRRLWWLLPVSMVSFSGIMYSQIEFSLRHPALFGFLPFVAATMLYYLISLVVNIGPRDFDFEAHVRLVREWSAAVKDGRLKAPSIDVFLPICGEDFALIRNTWLYVKQLAYPGELTVYVLNDGNDGEDELRLKALAEELGFVYLRRSDSGPNRRGTFKKAGNLLFGFHKSTGDFIQIFDADFAPAEDMLIQLVPYLVRDPKLGIVQSPQFFRTNNVHMNWLEHGAGAVQEWFYRVVQTSRNHWGSAICVGTCALYRRTALADNNGPTQIGHSEDVHTGFDLRRLGWSLLYVPVCLSTGVCPSVRSSFLTQQYRWCMGSMSLLGSRKFWAEKMRFRTRAGYLSGFMYYVHTAVMTVVSPLIPIALMVFYPGMVQLRNYVFLLPSIVYTLFVVPRWHRNRFGLPAMAVKMIYGWAHLFALLDILRRKRKGWQPTGNTGSTRGMLDRHFYVGSIVWGCGTAGLWVALATAHITVLHQGWRFVPLLLTGLVYSAIVGQMFVKTEPTELPELGDDLGGFDDPSGEPGSNGVAQDILEN